ncbi:MAG TPA: hypothetical protein VJN44_11315, partial [Roseateles sp.]|nr:hypothetical protein [Roseateles sp.]
RAAGGVGRATQLGMLIHQEDSAQKAAVLDALQAVAEEIGSNPGRVALAWAPFPSSARSRCRSWRTTWPR